MKKKVTSKSESIKFDTFKNLSNLLKPLKNLSFKKECQSFQNNKISSLLLKEIEKAKTPCFLLPAVIEFIEQVNQIIKPADYTFSHFEFWLNQFSGLTDEENYLIRAKIAGKHIPRDQYQILFPIGSGKRYAGSHYVTAHGSPDLDTTIASFWGWIDAFAARVSSGLHVWNVPPGGILATLEAAPLTTSFGKNLFKYLSQNRSSLSAMSIDFTSQDSLVKKHLEDSSFAPEDHERHKKAVLVIDSKGFYIGDLRSEDYESIRQIIRIVTNNLKWFENSLQAQFIHLFSKKTVTFKDIKDALNQTFSEEIVQCGNLSHLTEKLKEQIENFLQKILGMKKGLNASFRDLGHAFKAAKIQKLANLEQKIAQAFNKNKVFDSSGKLLNNREAIFKAFSEISVGIDQAIEELRTFLGSMDIAMKIKRQVLNFSPTYVTADAPLDEVLDKIEHLNHLTVVYPNEKEGFWPLGTIKAETVRSKSLGTVTVRDFCNRSEVKIDSNLEIISAIDHHKAELKTQTPPTAFIGDVQSCNILVAELSFIINDRYSNGQMTKKQIESEIKTLSSKPLSNAIIRVKNKLLERYLAQSHAPEFFIHPKREYFEYLTFLHAIIDDTDLLSKATKRDVLCIASLLNRMRSILDKKEVEILHFDSIKEDHHFVANAVREIVKNQDMYQIYKEIFFEREKGVQSAILNTASGKTMEIFSDTKEQNGCCRISQTKYFTKNVATLQKHQENLLSIWLQKAQEVYSNSDSIDLHLHMMSTIPSADDVYKGGQIEYKHKDCIWIWVPNSNQATHHLSSFLSAFKNLPSLKDIHIEYQVLNNSEVDYQSILKHHFIDSPAKEKMKVKKKMPVIILTFDAGTLNSRKAQITPYLPALVK